MASANDVAKLVARLELESAQFHAKLDKVDRRIAQFEGRTKMALSKVEKQFQKFGANVVRSLGIASLTAAVYGLSRSVLGAIQAGDDLAKFATKTGMSAEAATELAHAAKMADIELGAFATGIKKMQVEISKAGSTATGVTPALTALGLAFKDLAGLNTDQQFELIAEQISKLESPADRTRAAVELLGKAGSDLLPMMEQGAAGIRAARQEAIDLGKSFSAIDLKKFQEADDAIKRMKASTEALSFSFTSMISGPLAVIADRIRIAFGGATEEEKLQQALTLAEQSVQSFGKLIHDSPQGLQALHDYADALEALSNFRISRFDSGTLPKFDAPGFDSDDANKALAGQIASLEKQLALYGKVGKAAEIRYQIESGALGELAPKDQQRLLSLAMQLDSLEQHAQAVKDLEEEYSVLGNTMENAIAIQASRLNAPLIEGDLTRDVLPGLDSLNEKLKDIGTREIPEMGEAFKLTVDEMSVFAEQAARNMQDAFADFLFDPFEDGLRGMLKGFVDILRRMLAEAMSARIFEAIGGGSSGGGFLDFLGGIIGIGGAATGASSAASTGGGGSIGSLIPRADGGSVRAGGNYLVGERGPELFVPGASGSIIPNGMGKGLNVTYQIDARGATTDLVKALPAILQENNRRMMEALRDARSRGQF